MSIVTFSAVCAASVGTFVIGQQTYELEDTSDITGSSSSRVLGPPRWTVNMGAMPNLNADQSADWEALLLQMRGTVNRLALWDVSRPAPRGTMRGSLTLAATANAGDASISVTGGPGQASTTMKIGDWIQVGTGLGTSQLFKVMANATANGSGVISLTVEPTVRIAFSSGTTCAWDKPVAYFKKQGRSVNYAAEAGTLLYSGHALDLIEQWN